jgi:hypothetical protein
MKTDYIYNLVIIIGALANCQLIQASDSTNDSTSFASPTSSQASIESLDNKPNTLNIQKLLDSGPANFEGVADNSTFSEQNNDLDNAAFIASASVS